MNNKYYIKSESGESFSTESHKERAITKGFNISKAKQIKIIVSDKKGTLNKIFNYKNK